ncbi:MAG: F0F1 ATP synthase subunit B [Firmicutes bacterium]|nr:F0F1 ATP synthase subunit B [Bacillota bacterium]
MGVQFDTGTFLAMILNFIILMYVLVRLLYRPIQGILEERRLKISQALSEAEKIKKDAEQLHSDAQKRLEESHIEAYEIVERARNEAERLREELITQARQEADQLRQRAQAEIERAKTIARSELREEAVELALLAVKKVLGKYQTPQLNEAIIRGVLEEMSKGAAENDLPRGV